MPTSHGGTRVAESTGSTILLKKFAGALVPPCGKTSAFIVYLVEDPGNDNGEEDWTEGFVDSLGFTQSKGETPDLTNSL